ncbi:MAG: linear amide C-N hydrolase, partial [bacterium]|nr:linear amide C-N hydrolase [bacterium]
MRKHLSGIVIIIICICFLPGAVLPCTTFVIDNNGSPVYCKNMDWMPVPAYVMVNKRGVSKTTVPADNGTAAAWTSKYGSITFNWQARELPFEGINEAGLFISAMGFWDLKKFPEPDERPGMLVDQWIQYQLDNFSTLDEVIASDRDIRIEGPWIHFLVSDRQGNCAIIEFPYGEMVCYTGEAMPVKVLANTAY